MWVKSKQCMSVQWSHLYFLKIVAGSAFIPSGTREIIPFCSNSKWMYSCGFVRCSSQNLLKTVRNILVLSPSCFFSRHFIKVPVVHSYNSTNIDSTFKKSCFILSERSGFHMTGNLLIEVYAFHMHVLTMLSVDEILLPRHVNWITNFRGVSFHEEMVSSYFIWSTTSQ